MPSASEMIVQTLEEAGIKYVFGIPGGGTGQIFQVLNQDGTFAWQRLVIQVRGVML